MKHRLLHTLGLIVLVMVAFSTSPVNAQTTATGPYYATPSWDQQLPAATRFIVLSNWGGAAVLDRETGLVWEKSPSIGELPWLDAQDRCIVLTVANRAGWRLPTIQELASLVDKTQVPCLPPGHPFILLPSPSGSVYWSATSVAVEDPNAWVVGFLAGAFRRDDMRGTNFVWCVRGGLCGQ